MFLLDPSGDQAKRTQLGSNEGGAPAKFGSASSPAKRFIATIEPMHGNQVVVYTPSIASQASALWSRNVIDDSIKDGHAVACGDLLGLGSDQIVIGWRNMRGREIPACGFTFLWTRTERTGNRRSSMAMRWPANLCLADLNGDGKLDNVVASGRATKNLKIYFNLGSK